MENKKIKVGQKAVDFCLEDFKNRKICLKDFKGKNIALYFYPKDDTPGCTLEAIDFSKHKSNFQKNNTTILGISKDSCESHQKFVDKHSLTIALLSDPNSEVQKRYGVWRKKKFMGREFIGTVRTTVLIDKKGIIKHIWDKVKVKDHAEDVLEQAKTL